MDTEPLALAEFLERLRKRRHRVVPVAGSGAFVEAGAVSTQDLIDHFRTRSSVELPSDDDLFAIADRLEEVEGTRWVQDEVAGVIASQALAPSALLRALVRAPSGVFVTTNYDFGFEVAARDVGLEPRSFLLRQANEALDRPPGGSIHVLHIHGLIDDPESIVLTRNSYESAIRDERMQLALRLLASQNELLFLGFSFADREQHVRRDLLWSTNAFERTGPHWLVTPAGQGADEQRRALSEASVDVVTFVDTDSSYLPVKWIAQVVGASAVVGSPGELPLLDSKLIQPYYLQPAMAHSEEVETREEREVWEYLSRMRGASQVMVEDLDAMPRVALLGEGGYGKTQMLYHLGARAAGRWPAYVPLASAAPPREHEDPIDVFVSWFVLAQALAEGVPKITRSSLEVGVYTFLLDALDQASIEEREDVARVIAVVAEAYPQHQYVVSSRRLPEVVNLQNEGFKVVALVPRDDWLYEYARKRGLVEEQIGRLTAAVPAIADLLKIPLYGAAAVELLAGGGDLPSSALRLVEVVADKGLEQDAERARADPAQIRAWLDRVALMMELAGLSEIERDSLVQAGLESGLAVGAAEPLLEELITRALLAEGGGVVRFPANVVQEARAARFLLEHAAGLEVFERHVIVRVGEEMGIRSSWVHTIDLLLTAAPDDWRARVGAVDPYAAIRAIPPHADQDLRSAAIREIWAWYLKTKVWLPRDRRGELLDDRDMVSRLAQIQSTQN